MKCLLSAAAIAAVMETSLPALGSDLRSIIDAAADAQGIPRALAHAVVKVESNYNCHLLGSAGERGIMQVKPVTAPARSVLPETCSTAPPVRALAWPTFASRSRAAVPAAMA
ncbi:soluble lytic murein transglycosylase-like protein [Bradyrhizobium japonicum]